MRKIISIFTLLVTITVASYAQLQTDSIKVLFIGNSYTNYNRLPWLVQNIAHSDGIPLSVTMVEHGGWTLEKHASCEETLNAIKKGGWDFVVLQEQSQAPAREEEWVSKNVYPYAQKLDSLRKIYCPNGKTVFYMTWGHYNESYPIMQQKLANTYLGMAKRFRACCAPVGLAWRQYFCENHSGELHDSDKSHPNLRGSYLAASVFYTTFFGKPFQSSYTAGLPANEAQYLQKLAQKIVLENPEEYIVE
ncbi:SGNH/GDSL hydrolase family protein [Bacteroides sp. 519]|uniref:SGNH/GDSL hydrolase family protein n=1 Tax=Bacteroides sp. 519 TaxID=2302937 RepID=UPI0013D30DCD|nr:SGNH/GDSL hydrolase family protein [Bacteroides sp. 519]NDV57187.1 SGNH/GDSL hydrolase family protein [Bacteroides sp. 519]